MRGYKVDKNQKDIIKSLRKIGCSVKVTAELKGFVDIVVGLKGINYLFEIKNCDLSPSKRKLTPAENNFQSGWLGQVATIISFEEAVDCIKLSS